ncbi:MAG: hypothetical protein V2A73_09205, partial [Pseudomonadota bacterium]
ANHTGNLLGQLGSSDHVGRWSMGPATASPLSPSPTSGSVVVDGVDSPRGFLILFIVLVIAVFTVFIDVIDAIDAIATGHRLAHAEEEVNGETGADQADECANSNINRRNEPVQQEANANTDAHQKHGDD